MPKTLFIYCSNTFLSGILSYSFFYGWDGYTPPQHREVHPIFPHFYQVGWLYLIMPSSPFYLNKNVPWTTMCQPEDTFPAKRYGTLRVSWCHIPRTISLALRLRMQGLYSLWSSSSSTSESVRKIYERIYFLISERLVPAFPEWCIEAPPVNLRPSSCRPFTFFRSRLLRRRLATRHKEI